MAGYRSYRGIQRRVCFLWVTLDERADRCSGQKR